MITHTALYASSKKFIKSAKKGRWIHHLHAVRNIWSNIVAKKKETADEIAGLLPPNYRIFGLIMQPGAELGAEYMSIFRIDFTKNHFDLFALTLCGIYLDFDVV